MKIVTFKKCKIEHNFKNLILDKSSFEVVKRYQYHGQVIKYNLEDDDDIKYKLNKVLL